MIIPIITIVGFWATALGVLFFGIYFFLKCFGVYWKKEIKK